MTKLKYSTKYLQKNAQINFMHELPLQSGEA